MVEGETDFVVEKSSKEENNDMQFQQLIFENRPYARDDKDVVLDFSDLKFESRYLYSKPPMYKKNN